MRLRNLLLLFVLGGAIHYLAANSMVRVAGTYVMRDFDSDTGMTTMSVVTLTTANVLLWPMKPLVRFLPPPAGRWGHFVFVINSAIWGAAVSAAAAFALRNRSAVRAT